jgi:hypothetical protein
MKNFSVISLKIRKFPPKICHNVFLGVSNTETK